MYEHWPLAERYSSLWVGGSAQQIEMFGFMMCRLIYYLVFFSTLTFHCRGWPLSRLLSSVLTLKIGKKCIQLLSWPLQWRSAVKPKAELHFNSLHFTLLCVTSLYVLLCCFVALSMANEESQFTTLRGTGGSHWCSIWEFSFLFCIIVRPHIQATVAYIYTGH